MVRHQGLRAVFLLTAFFALSSRYAWAGDPNFELDGKANKTNAIVSNEEFQLSVTLGTGELGLEKKFTLTVGGCAIEIEPIFLKDKVTCKLKGGKSQTYVDDLDSIVVKNSSGVTLVGAGSPQILACEVNFGEKTAGGKFYVPVELLGDVPSGFKLHSTEVKMGDPPSDKKADGAGLGPGAIAGIIAAVLVGFLAVSSIVGFIFYRLHMNKALQNTRVGDRMKTAKSLEQLPATPKTPDPASTQAASTVDNKTMKPKEKNEAPAKANKKGRSETKTESTKSVKKVSNKPKPKDNKKDKAENKQESSKESRVTRKPRYFSAEESDSISPA